MNKKILAFILVFLIGFLSVQRFTISFYVYVPLLIFLLIPLASKADDQKQRLLTLLLLGLFFLVDNGGNYGEAPIYLRYSFYILLLLSIFFTTNGFFKYKTVIFLFFCLFLFLYSLFVEVTIGYFHDWGVFINNIQIMFLLLLIFCSVRNAKIDNMLFFNGVLGYLIGELINVLFFYNNSNEYLNYSSLKGLVIFPALYVTVKNFSLITKMLLWAVVVYVLLHFGSRMLIVSLVFLTIVMTVTNLNTRNFGKIIFLVFITYAASFFDIVGLTVDLGYGKYKAAAVIPLIISKFSGSSILDLVKFLDPVRLGEHLLFFDRPFFQIVLGNGLGSGVFDGDGVLDIANSHATAFSPREIRSSVYFNFHDIWIDFSLRFGILTSAVIVFFLWKDYKNRQDFMRTFLLGFLIINSTYTISGLLMTTILALSFYSVSKDDVSKTV